MKDKEIGLLKWLLLFVLIELDNEVNLPTNSEFFLDFAFTGENERDFI